MDVDELVRAVRAALDETERLARRAPGPDWRFDRTSSFGPRVIVGDGEDDVWEREVNPSVWTCDDELDGCPDEARGWIAEGQHIARHDPAAVLRQVAAERRVLERHQPRMLPATHYRPEVVECEHCVRMCHSRSGLACDDPTDAPWPCDEILDLADRLGIDPEVSE